MPLLNCFFLIAVCPNALNDSNCPVIQFLFALQSASSCPARQEGREREGQVERAALGGGEGVCERVCVRACAHAARVWPPQTDLSLAPEYFTLCYIYYCTIK